MVEYSCKTPAIVTSVGAAPFMEESKIRRNALPNVCPKPRSNGSIDTLARVAESVSTSIVRGFKNSDALLCIKRFLNNLAII